MAYQSRPEPMNASPHHSKVKVTLALSDPAYVSGGHISGKMEVESRADLDSLLGIGMMMVELYAIQGRGYVSDHSRATTLTIPGEVSSGQRSATSTFIHSRRLFQGPGLPPSNAVHTDYVPGTGESPLPAHHYAARRGQTTFFFQFPVPPSSPSSIIFGPASIKYEIRASVSVAWKGNKCLVTDKQEVKVVEIWDPTNATPPPQAVTITEGGKIWTQATLTNDVVVGGESACVDLQLKNRTQRWTSGITVTLTRDLHFSQSLIAGKSPPNISDVCTQVEFRGLEYSVPPGIEGIATLVINIPRHSRGTKGGLRVDGNGKATEDFFEVRCALRIRIEMPPGSEDTVVILPLTIYHPLAVPELPTTPSPRLTSPCLYAASVSPPLLSPFSGAGLISSYTGNQMQEYDLTWTSPSAQSVSDCLSNQHRERDSHNWQEVSYSYAPPIQHSMALVPRPQAPYYTSGLSTSYTSPPRLLPPLPTHVPYTGYTCPGASTEAVDGCTNSNHIGGAVVSQTSQDIQSPAYRRSVSPSSQRYPSQSRAQNLPPLPSRAPPPPIQIPSLPNPHDLQGIVHSPRPVLSPKHSFHGSVPKSNNVSELERMADEVVKKTGNLKLDLPKGDAGVIVRGPHCHTADQQVDLSADKTLPGPPGPSSKDRQLLVQHPHANAHSTTEETMASHSSLPPSMDCIPRAPPTPPIAAITPITPIKFSKAPMELSGLGANLGKDMPPESGLDVLERRLLAEVGTRKFDVKERPHVRSVVQPITIPPSGPPRDTVNDSAISSLTLADREGFLNPTPERENEPDRDSDERTQHNERGGHSPSEDDRDARTQKSKNSRRLGKSKHSEEDLERTGRRRERKKVKADEGRKLRQEAKGRVAAWLGEIDVSVPPVMEDLSLFISPTVSHFVPITESASFGPAPAEMADKVEDHCGGDISTDKDVSASPNPRSSGFVTISTLNIAGVTSNSGGEASSLKPSPRRSSLNDFRQTPSSSPNRPSVSRPPSAEVKRPEALNPFQKKAPQAQAPPTQPTRLFPGRLPRFSLKPVDPEVKYDVRSARGGRGGKVAQAAALWAAKANVNANDKTGEMTPIPHKKPKLTASPAPRKPTLNALKQSPVSACSPPTGLGGGGYTSPNRIGAIGNETRMSLSTGMGLGTRDMSKPSKATTVPAILSSSHAVPMLSSTASLARSKVHGLGQGLQGRTLPPMISETLSDLRSASKSASGGKTGASTGGGSGGQGRDLAFGQARLRDLIKKHQG